MHFVVFDEVVSIVNETSTIIHGLPANVTLKWTVDSCHGSTPFAKIVEAQKLHQTWPCDIEMLSRAADRCCTLRKTSQEYANSDGEMLNFPFAGASSVKLHHEHGRIALFSSAPRSSLTATLPLESFLLFSWCWDDCFDKQLEQLIWWLLLPSSVL
jgi:hypothetical protein